MTFREKLQMEHPECMGENYGGGCEGCPDSYGYEKRSRCGWEGKESVDCTQCWNREMPGEEPHEIDAADYIEIHTDGHKKGYAEGLNDAWEIARKIFEMSSNDFDDAFGDVYKEDVFCHYTPQEAFAKLEAYEEQSKIEVGDVVVFESGEKGIVTFINSYGSFFGVCEDGKLFADASIGSLKKTGRHIDIESILEQIREV